MVGGQHSLKISAPQPIRFGIDSVLKILNKRITQLMNHKGVYRTAAGTPGLLITLSKYKQAYQWQKKKKVWIKSLTKKTRLGLHSKSHS